VEDFTDQTAELYHSHPNETVANSVPVLTKIMRFRLFTVKKQVYDQ